MEITTSVTVPDYVYLFYQKAAQEMHLSKADDLMAVALLRCSQSLSEEILMNHDAQ